MEIVESYLRRAVDEGWINRPQSSGGLDNLAATLTAGPISEEGGQHDRLYQNHASLITAIFRTGLAIMTIEYFYPFCRT